MKANTFIKLTTLSAILFCLGSCKSFFTVEMSRQFADEQVKKIQFYTSQKIVLRRELAKGEQGTTKEQGISNGKIELINGKFYEVVKINKLAPGVCLQRTDSLHLNISFDTTKRTIRYIGVKNKKYDSYRFVWSDKDSTVVFGNKNYKIVTGQDAELLVKKSEGGGNKAKEVLKGRKVD